MFDHKKNIKKHQFNGDRIPGYYLLINGDEHSLSYRPVFNVTRKGFYGVGRGSRVVIEQSVEINFNPFGLFPSLANHNKFNCEIIHVTSEKVGRWCLFGCLTAGCRYETSYGDNFDNSLLLTIYFDHYTVYI